MSQSWWIIIKTPVSTFGFGSASKITLTLTEVSLELYQEFSIILLKLNKQTNHPTEKGKNLTMLAQAKSTKYRLTSQQTAVFYWYSHKGVNYTLLQYLSIVVSWILSREQTQAVSQPDCFFSLSFTGTQMSVITYAVSLKVKYNYYNNL